jgi:uncharacterized delta-60 repeat protein
MKTKSNTIRWLGMVLGCSLLKERLAVLLTALVTLLPAAAQAQAIQAWVQRYNGPGNGDDWAIAMAVDASNNVIVAGYSDVSGYQTNYDYATIKYSSAGVPLWTNRYNGPGNRNDYAYGVAVDGSNNVIVTGYSYDSSGRSYCATIKYSSVGVPLWTNRSTGPGEGKALAVDSNGNVIVTMSAYISGYWPNLDFDFLTIRYSGAGALLWTNRYSGPGGGEDYPVALAVDAEGNVVVTGRSPGSHYATIKYSSAGVPLWTNLYNYGGNDMLFAMAMDSSGNVAVTGRSQADTTGLDFLTIEYSSAGVPLWTNRYEPGATPRAVAMDARGNVYVTGSGAASDYATIAYSSAGVLLWTNHYIGLGSPMGGQAVAVDARGNVFVTGESDGSGAGYDEDYTTIGHSSAGVPLWTNRYNGPANGREYARAMALDASGSVYVTGSSTGNGSGQDFATVKYVIPPIIARQPLSRTNAIGTTASFTVEAAGGVPLGYQWRREGTNLVDSGNVSGVTTTDLQIANVELADATGYSVVVTNAYGSATSSVAQLTVYIPPNPGRFTKLSYSPDTGFSFIFRDATVGQPYRIQFSQSLAEGIWTDWMSFNYTGPMALTDLGAPETERRFYRAVTP